MDRLEEVLRKVYVPTAYRNLARAYEEDLAAGKKWSKSSWEVRARKLRPLLSAVGYCYLERFKVRRVLGVTEQMRGFVASYLKLWRWTVEHKMHSSTLFNSMENVLNELGEFWYDRQHPGSVRR